MAHLSQLLSRLPGNIDVRMSTMGHVVWVSWHDRLAPAVGQTLLNYGGMLVGEEAEQSIWFFFTDDVFLALARLMVWGNFNELPVAIELFPGRLQFGRKREVNLLLDGALQAQQIVVTDALEIWIHPKSREGKKGLPGITFERRSGRQGMAGVDWASMTVDVRMPYASTQSWLPCWALAARCRSIIRRRARNHRPAWQPLRRLRPCAPPWARNGVKGANRGCTPSTPPA